MLFEVEFYEKSDGTYPAEEFILSQDIKMRAKLFRLLELLELKGNELREPYSKALSDGIFEIRAIQGNNITTKPGKSIKIICGKHPSPLRCLGQ